MPSLLLASHRRPGKQSGGGTNMQHTASDRIAQWICRLSLSLTLTLSLSDLCVTYCCWVCDLNLKLLTLERLHLKGHRHGDRQCALNLLWLYFYQSTLTTITSRLNTHTAHSRFRLRRVDQAAINLNKCLNCSDGRKEGSRTNDDSVQKMCVCVCVLFVFLVN